MAQKYVPVRQYRDYDLEKARLLLEAARLTETYREREMQRANEAGDPDMVRQAASYDYNQAVIARRLAGLEVERLEQKP